MAPSQISACSLKALHRIKLTGNLTLRRTTIDLSLDDKILLEMLSVHYCYGRQQWNKDWLDILCEEALSWMEFAKDLPYPQLY